MKSPSYTLRRAALPALAISALALAGCSGTSEPETTAAASDSISEERCAANQAAGEIIFLTSFAYAASGGILDVVAADDLGYFDELCLDVTIDPGSTNTQLVSAGTAQMAGVGGASDVLVAIDNDADIVGIATYGNTGAIEILTMADSGIDSLEDFVGTTVGYKGAVAPQFSAMFIDAGIDPETINWVSVGYDPTILPDGQVQGLGGYKSNEPINLANQGYDVVEWDPNEFGIESTFNTIIANTGWAEENPTAVEDFMRATFHAFDWINESDENLDEALGFAEARSDAGYDLGLSKQRWETEMDLITSTQPEETGTGWQSVDQWQGEADTLLRFDLVASEPDVATAQENSYHEAIFDGAELIWPAP